MEEKTKTPASSQPQVEDEDSFGKDNFVEGPETAGNTFWRNATAAQFVYSMTGLVIGMVCIIGGMVLFLHGVTGSVGWITTILGSESKLSDAAPGAVLFIVGLFIIFVTRFSIRVQSAQKATKRKRSAPKKEEKK